MQPNKNTISNSAEYHIQHGPGHVNLSQDEAFQSSRTYMLKHPDGEEQRPTRPVQAVLVGSHIIVDGRGLNFNDGF
jgi:hypothetical protein